MIRFLDAASELVATVLAFLAGFYLIAMMLLACANMVLRAFNTPVPGTFELMGFFGAVVAAFSLGFAQRRKAHIAVGILLARFPAWFRRLADGATNALSCGFFLLAGVETWKWGQFLIQTNEVSETLQIIYHPFVFASSAGCLALAFVLAVDTLKVLTAEKAA